MRTHFDVVLANPRGFCAGVDRAIHIVKQALITVGAPIYVRHEVVHNQFVVNELRQQGAIFVENLDSIPIGSTVVFSAHGVSRAVQQEARERKLNVFDATCPLVTKVHGEVQKMHAAGMKIIMIGHKGHPEVEGTMGQVKDNIYLVETLADIDDLPHFDTESLAYVTQTTLSIDDANRIIALLKKKFPHIQAPKSDDICYATQNRQNAVKQLLLQCDLILVVGSHNSSNATRLCDVAKEKSIAAYLIETAQQIQASWLEHKHCVGVTSGASTPEVLVQEVITWLKQYGARDIHIMQGITENIVFQLPKKLASLVR